MAGRGDGRPGQMSPSDTDMQDVDDTLETLVSQMQVMGFREDQARAAYRNGHTTVQAAMDFVEKQASAKTGRGPPASIGKISIPGKNVGPGSITQPKPAGDSSAPGPGPKNDDMDEKYHPPRAQTRQKPSRITAIRTTPPDEQKSQAVTQPDPRSRRKSRKALPKVTEQECPRGNCMRYIKKRRVLAETLYGCVRKGTDRVTGDLVIIKESRKDLVKKKQSAKGIKVREDIRKEIQIHGFLSNPSSHGVSGVTPCPFILRSIDVCQDPNYIYQILEPCPGDLFDHIVELHDKCMGSDKWRQSESSSKKNDTQRDMFRSIVEIEVRRLYKQIMEAVRFMHKLCVCHLDLSLENVLIGSDGAARVCDFGLGAYCGSSSTGNRFNINGCFGKRGYMAPEMMISGKTDGRKDDMWSCAVILFCMLLNSPPYDTPNIADFKFELLWSGRVRDYLRRCGRAHLFSDEAVDVLEKLFRPENDRPLPRDILSMAFFQVDAQGNATSWTYGGRQMPPPR